MVIWLKLWPGFLFFLRLMGLPSCLEFFSIKQALKGYHKAKFLPDGRWPISLEFLADLSAVTSVVCFSGYEALLFCTAFSLIFFGALQISELVLLPRHGSSGILFDHVWLTIHLSGYFYAG